MKTQLQIRTEVYNALTNSTDITDIVGNRINWVNRPTVEVPEDSYPLIVYQFISMGGSYTLGDTFLSSEDFMLQTTVYGDPDDITEFDNLVQAVKNAMNGIKWRNVTSSGEITDDTINKVLMPLRWEDFNV